MTFTIAIGWWLVPTLLSAAAFLSAWLANKDKDPGTYGAGAILDLAVYLAAAVVSLLSWLVWALLR